MKNGKAKKYLKIMVMVLILASIAIPGKIGMVTGAGTNILNKDIFVSGYPDPQWFKDNVPFLECPDSNIQDVFYYRWNMYRMHIKSTGDPSFPYIITEFLPSVPWEGLWGSISCAAGHHVYEGRWIKNQQYLESYQRFWFRKSGANPRLYSCWLGDAYYARYLVNNDAGFLTDLLNDLVNNYNSWTSSNYDSGRGLFFRIPDRDGMEYSLLHVLYGSVDGFRPTINSYMYGDAMAIKKIADLAGNTTISNDFANKAATLKTNFQNNIWNSSLTHFVDRKRSDFGFIDGREQEGYIPWYFNLPDSGYSASWSQLMDSQGFFAAYGPTTLERRHREFMVDHRGGDCIWNGPSWPYATSQTLTALANLLNNYTQSYITKDNYFTLLQNYAKTQYKNGSPYIAEDHYPDTANWMVDIPNRSEHYNHSTYCDLVINGLIGLRPRADNVLEVNPLVPSGWNYFCLEDVLYHNHLITILYDKTGTRYNRGSGLRIFADGNEIASSASITKVTVNLPPAPTPTPTPTATPTPAVTPTPASPNYALNTSGSGYPSPSASFTYSGDNVWQAVDGAISYTNSPRNRWTCWSSGNATDWLAVDFGSNKTINWVKLYIYDDGGGVKAPAGYNIQYWNGSSWVDAAGQSKTPATPVGNTVNAVTFTQVSVSRVRVVFTHQSGSYSGVTEIEVFGPVTTATATPTPTPNQTATPTPTPVNLALNTAKTGYPAPTASYTSQWDNIWQAVDGVISYTDSPRSRWTSYNSGNTSDWLAIDFGTAKTAGKVKLYIYNDGGGVKTPVSFNIQYWNGSAWVDAASQVKAPSSPTGNALNTVTFTQVSTQKVRAVFIHQSGSYSGVSEIEIFSN